MIRTVRPPRARCVSPLLVAAAMSLVACGSDAVTPNADTTTLPPSTVSQEDDVTTTDSDPDADEPSDTIRPPEDTAPPTAGEPTESGPPIGTDPPVDDAAPVELTPTQQALADVAIDDLVERRGVERSDVVVVEVAEVTWPDGALGCPQRDMQYMQVLTPGLRVVVEADGQRAFYHGTSVGDLAYCAAPRPPVDA